MPKYSTGSGGGGGDGDSCELCGRSTGNLSRANVAGAQLLVCSDCAPHDDSPAARGASGSGSGASGQESDDEPSREQRAAQRQARLYDQTRGDASHWESGTDYEDDGLPYLVSDYGDAAEAARQDAGLTVEELASELGVEAADVDAVEQGRATRAGVGGSVVRALEERLGVELVDE